MKLKLFLLLGMSAGIILSCQKETDFIVEEEALIANDDSALKGAKSKNAGFVHGIEIEIDGKMYYFAGPPHDHTAHHEGHSGPHMHNSAHHDVPGHYWVQAGKNKVVGKHYNTGPGGMASWWSSDAGDGELLYVVKCIIDTWSEEKAEYYASRGYVHYHEFVSVSPPHNLHPTKVPWLKHTAVTSFTLDGGPLGQGGDPPYIHDVTPGVDYEFPNNYLKPYNP